MKRKHSVGGTKAHGIPTNKKALSKVQNPAAMLRRFLEQTQYSKPMPPPTIFGNTSLLQICIIKKKNAIFSHL